MVINIEARPSSANQRGSRIIKESIRAELPPINGHAYGLNKNLIKEKAEVSDSSNKSKDNDETMVFVTSSMLTPPTYLSPILATPEPSQISA